MKTTEVTNSQNIIESRDIIDRIEELEREVAGWKASAENRLEIQRQRENQLAVTQAREAELIADNTRLREALKLIKYETDIHGNKINKPIHVLAKKTLAASPAQSLARYRNDVLEKAAKRCLAEAPRRDGVTCRACATTTATYGGYFVPTSEWGDPVTTSCYRILVWIADFDTIYFINIQCTVSSDF